MHEDLEIAIPAATFPAFRDALPEFIYLVPFPEGMRPVDDASAMASSHQTWARDEEGRYRFDVMREPHDEQLLPHLEPAAREWLADACTCSA